MIREKLARDISKAVRTKLAYDLDSDIGSEAGYLASLAGLGGLGAYGAVRAKRDLEDAAVSSLKSTIRASELTNRISDEARANELLRGNSLFSIWKEQLRRKFNINKLIRDYKASVSRPALETIKTLQRNKIL